MYYKVSMWVKRGSDRKGDKQTYYDSAFVVSKLDNGFYEMEMLGMDARCTRLGFFRGTRFYCHESQFLEKLPIGKIELVPRFLHQEFHMENREIPKKLIQLAQVTQFGTHYAHVFREIETGLPVMRKDGKFTLWYPDTLWKDLLPFPEKSMYVDFHRVEHTSFLETRVLDYDLLFIQIE